MVNEKAPVCYVCQSESYFNLLSQRPTAIWTNNSDISKNPIKYECILHQCRSCGHIYQLMTGELSNILSEIYKSEHAQLSTPMGSGNWGKDRGSQHLDMLCSLTDITKYKSVVEIGCGDGYFLRDLKARGIKKLVGIEPSITHAGNIEDILFIKSFVNDELQLMEQYDFIYAISVFEHIENIGSIFRFCHKHLNSNGELFFEIPDIDRNLSEGDPALFSHQHIQYFSEDSIKRCLAYYGFEVKGILRKNGSMNVLAGLGGQSVNCDLDVCLNNYTEELNKVCEHAGHILKLRKTLVHGASNALNNILEWIDGEYNFTLVDNDVTKQGKVFFSKVVKSLSDVNLTDFERVLIIPNAFFENIKAEYIQRGFKGRIEGLHINNLLTVGKR